MTPLYVAEYFADDPDDERPLSNRCKPRVWRAVKRPRPTDREAMPDAAERSKAVPATPAGGEAR